MDVHFHWLVILLVYIAGMHCNAHGNNFVLVPPQSDASAPFLAPVDFDLAFDVQSYVDTLEPAAACQDRAREQIRLEIPV
jgi:hypothetical protein